METPDLFIFAGEASGDLHGKHLLDELFSAEPNLKVCGVGGPKMRTLPFECFMPTENFQVMGFSDVLFALPKLVKNFYKIRNFILKKQPKAVIFIDYPGFNLRMAKALRKKGFKNKLIQYIAPTVWAWKKNRIKTMEETLDLLLTIFPFENHSFKDTSLPSCYVGNPLIAQINNHRYHSDWKANFAIPETFFALFPGSRLGEIKRNLPLQLQAAKNLQLPFVISCSHEKFQTAILAIVKQNNMKEADFKIITEKYNYDVMKDAAFAISKSGTATLELALHGCPTVMMYQLSKLNYFIAKYLFRINLPHYCIANILLNETLFPEMIGVKLNPTDLSEKARRLCKTQAMLGAKRLQDVLTKENASLNAAKAVLDLLRKSDEI